MQNKTALRWLKESVKISLFLIVFSVILGWFRNPVQPADFAARPLTTMAQQTTDLTRISRDRTAVLYFWGTWCGYCKYTSPAVEKLRAAGIPVLSIAMSSGDDAAVKSYMQKNGLNFDTVNDPDGILSRQWNVFVTPTIVLLKNGKMVHGTTGFSTSWGLRARILLADWIN